MFQWRWGFHGATEGGKCSSADGVVMEPLRVEGASVEMGLSWSH